MNRKLSYVILALAAFFSLAQPAAAFTTVSATASNKRLLILAASGYRNRTSGDLNNVGSNGNYWSAAQNSADNAYNLNFNSGNVNPLNNNNRANGFSVLPVRAFNRLGIFKANDMQLTRGQIYALVVAAYLDARQNERNKNSALAFELDLENNLKTLADRLYRREWKPGPVICFMITEPTLREVFAPLFEDRIVSHVLFNLIAPLFDRTLIYDSYSCRKGKGTLFGVERFQHHIRAATDNYTHEAFILSFDISGYFMNINKGILYNILCCELEKFRYRRGEGGRPWGETLDYSFIDYLLRAILFRNPTENCVLVGDQRPRAELPPQKSLFFSPLGTGLTIGDVMSQLLSNIYLNPLDQYIKREIKIRHYGRYVDDGRGVDARYTFLEEAIQPIGSFLWDRLNLRLHPKKVKITSTRQDAFFLGADCREYRRYVKNSSVASFHRAVNQLEFWQATAAPSCLDDYYKALARLNSYLGYFRHFKAYNIVARTLDESPLRQVFAFTPYYGKAVLRPEIKEQFNYTLV